MIKNITFDLDGTLIDSFKTIYKTTEKVLDQLGISKPLDEREFYKRIGHHFIDIFNELEIHVKNFDEFIDIYKKYYFDYIGESIVYGSLVDVLEFLKREEIAISLLTTKGQDQADKIIDHFNLRKYFSLVMGRRENIANKPSPEPLLIICKELKVIPEETLMVGDTELDIQCGKNAGTKTCGCTYGYRPKKILAKESPDYLISKISELPELIKSLNS
ncbi:MAG: HAD family hydrolase [Ignavibacteriaceae bacterium]